MQESSLTKEGKRLTEPHQTPVGKGEFFSSPASFPHSPLLPIVGLQICYDLRFSAGAANLRRRGAELILYNSAFTARTGPPHWEVLLRARAIENQSYVLAANQVCICSSCRPTLYRAFATNLISFFRRSALTPPDVNLTATR